MHVREALIIERNRLLNIINSFISINNNTSQFSLWYIDNIGYFSTDTHGNLFKSKDGINWRHLDVEAIFDNLIKEANKSEQN